MWRGKHFPNAPVSAILQQNGWTQDKTRRNFLAYAWAAEQKGPWTAVAQPTAAFGLANGPRFTRPHANRTKTGTFKCKIAPVAYFSHWEQAGDLLIFFWTRLAPSNTDNGKISFRHDCRRFSPTGAGGNIEMAATALFAVDASEHVITSQKKALPSSEIQFSPIVERPE